MYKMSLRLSLYTAGPGELVMSFRRVTNNGSGYDAVHRCDLTRKAVHQHRLETGRQEHIRGSHIQSEVACHS